MEAKQERERLVIQMQAEHEVRINSHEILGRRMNLNKDIVEK